MLWWVCRETDKDKIRNEHIRGTTIMTRASKKTTERLKWYGHMMRREEHKVRKVLKSDIAAKRK